MLTKAQTRNDKLEHDILAVDPKIKRLRSQFREGVEEGFTKAVMQILSLAKNRRTICSKLTLQKSTWWRLGNNRENSQCSNYIRAVFPTDWGSAVQGGGRAPTTCRGVRRHPRSLRPSFVRPFMFGRSTAIKQASEICIKSPKSPFVQYVPSSNPVSSPSPFLWSCNFNCNQSP